jgi:hypothetical protein
LAQEKMKLILEGKVREGQTVRVDAKDGALEFQEK